MSRFQITALLLTLVLLLLLSAFFSAAETGLMALNRYRLRHRARMKKRSAIAIIKLLKRPDRLLGMILIGNNCTNIFASALVTILALYFFGEKAVIISTVILTFIVLIFCEITPKTLAAVYPDQVARLVAYPVRVALIVFYPIVWLLNVITNGVLRMVGFKVIHKGIEPLSREELRSVVYETSGRISNQYQNMLLGILDLNKVNVEDVMIPRHHIVGIDLKKDWNIVLKHLEKSDYDWLPVYRDNINHVIGILHMRDWIRESIASIASGPMTQEKLLKILQEPYFVPEGTPLNIQLLNFQRERKRLALIVDEYGEIVGLVTLADIFEEIIGEFTTVTSVGKLMEVQSDGSYLVDATITMRELNRLTQWELPTKGARTLNGLIIDYLETIPRHGVCIKIANHPIELIEIKENRVKVARVYPEVKQ